MLREQPYVEIARQSGASGLTIIFREMMPNLIPYITASFVASVAGLDTCDDRTGSVRIGRLRCELSGHDYLLGDPVRRYHTWHVVVVALPASRHRRDIRQPVLDLCRAGRVVQPQTAQAGLTDQSPSDNPTRLDTQSHPLPPGILSHHLTTTATVAQRALDPATGHRMPWWLRTCASTTELPPAMLRPLTMCRFRIKPGERFALVGESGSGKSTLAMAIMRLTRPPGSV